MRTLLVDNYDSYSYNLAALIASVTGSSPIVVKNDELSCQEALSLPLDCIVLSPGPGSPASRRDVGISMELLARTSLPVLGVCLGHQIIAHQCGARVAAAEHPAHGVVSRVTLKDDCLFKGIPETIEAVRYHSLAVAPPLPASLIQIGAACDGTIMAIRHARRPLWGVQFHPEAACTKYGELLISNFRDLVVGGSPAGTRGSRSRAASVVTASAPSASAAPGLVRLHLTQREVSCRADPLCIYESLYRHGPPSFWLDTNAARDSHSWSFIGALTGPLDHLTTAAGNVVTTTGADGRSTVRKVDSVWEHLRSLLARYVVAGESDAPFLGGYVGYFGYGVPTSRIKVARSARRLPDLALLFCTRFLAIDHASGRVLVSALHTAGERDQAAEWTDGMCGALEALPASAPRQPPAWPDPAALAAFISETALDTQQEYEEKVRVCIQKITEGETYEVCLTTGFEGPALADPFGVYRILRLVNPAPYSAYLDFGNVQVLSSSPERFLRIGRDRRAEAKPIKGTAPRQADPVADAAAADRLAADPKMRAENMMIVDLLRNDLNRVCATGTVRVDSLMHVESYQTVHQLVSTISGRLSEGRTALEVVESCFPGGSMTGAPKLRTMEIISELEQHAREAYAGTLGILSLDGYTDLSIVIRAIVNDPQRWFVGAGGAVLIGSNATEEYTEMIHKASPPVAAILLTGQAER